MKLKRDPNGHKGTFGTLFVIGGFDKEITMLGGPVLAAKAAYRSGVGKVYIGMPNSLMTAGLELLPEAIGVSLNDSNFENKLLNNELKLDAIVVGPGWGIGEDQKQILSVVLKTKIPIVIDGDALNIIAKYPEFTQLIHKKCILTPHLRELERLNSSLGYENAEQVAQNTDGLMISKSSETVVTDGRDSWRHNKPNSTLAVAGSGDVLSGILGGLLAQYSETVSLFDIAKQAVLLHAETGARLKPGSLASEIADAIDIN